MEIRHEKPLVLIICEDTGGVKTYLDQTLRSATTDKIAIKVVGLGKDPSQMLSHARLALKKGSRTVPPADFVILVYDCDEHSHFNAVCDACHKDDRLFSIVSIPCFEYFFLLHFEMTTKSSNNYSELLPRLNAHTALANYEKKKYSVPVAQLSELHEVAIKRCAQARMERQKTDAANPLTDADLLFEIVAHAKQHGLSKLKEEFVGKLFIPKTQ